jgi:tRNA nucleotidyltransferase/poly(A) polymerase
MNKTMSDYNIPSYLPKDRKAWLVGGAVRDILLGKTPKDLDIITAENAFEYAQILAQRLDTKSIRLGKAPFIIHRISKSGYIYDIANLNGSSIEQDLLRRDFSINAIAWELPSGSMIDCTSGFKDIKQKLIRMVSDIVFKNDPIRLLRAFRLASTLTFQVEKKTFLAIKDHAHLVKTAAAERVHIELLKILGTPNCTETIMVMKRAGLLQHILPEVTKLEKCHQNQYHDFDAYHHTMAALSALEEILAAPEIILKPEHFIFKKKVDLLQKPERLKLALLLHDIGKPLSRSVGFDGKVHFHCHEKTGMVMAEKICRRLALSNRMRTYITFIIGNHLYPMLLFLENKTGRLSEHTTIKLFRKIKALTPDLLLHAAADFSGKRRSNDRVVIPSEFINFTQKLLVNYFNYLESIENHPPLITGCDLIKIFGLTPSPLFKTILNAVEEGRLTDQLKSRSEALRWVKSFVDKIRANHGS